MYLDHWALRRLSENATLGGRFLDAFSHCGTVMFSVMNVVEIANDFSPERSQQIREFLEKLGPQWVPMTIDPLRIINAEETGTAANDVHPCVSAGFLSDPQFAARLTTGAVSLAHVVDLTRGTNGKNLKSACDRNTALLRKNIQDWRDDHAKNPKDLDIKFPLLKFDAAEPMRGIYHGLARYTIIDDFPLDDNHARDLFHAVVSVRCADLVTLDSHWAEQVRKLKLPADFVRVYSGKLDSFDRFLSDLEEAPATR